MSVLFSVLAGAFIPLSPAAAKVLGTCQFDGQDNPGLGCKSTSEGKACTINGKDGTCASVPFFPTSLKGCVCQVGGKMPEEAEAKAQAQSVVSASCGATVTFAIDPGSRSLVDVVLPPSLGGKYLRLPSFTGSFTVTSRAIAGQPTRCRLTIDSGELEAPSLTLPNGQVTGPNTFTFGPAAASSGVLDLSTGAYAASASGRISNDLYPEISTAGTYRGTLSFATGQLTLDSTTLDDLTGIVVGPYEP